MWVNGRRRPDLRLWQSAKREFAAIVAERDALAHELGETMRELAAITRDRDRLLSALNELRSANAAVALAQHELRELYRTRDIERAQRAERDLASPLH